MANTKDYAVVIGLNDYKGLEPLKGPYNDAVAFKEWLLSSDGGDMPAGNCFFIQAQTIGDETRPLQYDIDKALNNIYTKGKTTGYRRFYFFFAGHGLGIRFDESALCLPEWSDTFRFNALSSNEYHRYIVESGLFEEVFFFMDSCRNRKVAAGGLRPTLGWVKPGDGTGKCNSFLAFGAEFDNRAFEAENQTTGNKEIRGYFTRALIMGLKSPDRNGVVTTTSLKSFLNTKVTELAAEDQVHQQAKVSDDFTAEVVITGAPMPTEVAVEISFSRANGEVVLEDPALNEVKRGDAATGPWKLNLGKGRYSLRYTADNNEAIMKIDLTVNPFVYVF
jgi:Caspase domain